MTDHEQASYYGYDCYCRRCADDLDAHAAAEFDARSVEELDLAAGLLFAAAEQRRADEHTPAPWDLVPF